LHQLRARRAPHEISVVSSGSWNDVRHRTFVDRETDERSMNFSAAKPD
jgi:hypothetical protein